MERSDDEEDEDERSERGGDEEDIGRDEGILRLMPIVRCGGDESHTALELSTEDVRERAPAVCTVLSFNALGTPGTSNSRVSSASRNNSGN